MFLCFIFCDRDTMWLFRFSSLICMMFSRCVCCVVTCFLSNSSADDDAIFYTVVTRE